MSLRDGDKQSEPPTVILAGSTGIGKTELAVAFALRHRLEMICADSMQVYRGMAIGTAQPTVEETKGVPIHGCGIWDPWEPFNAKKYLDLSQSAHRTILGRGNRPIYVGGTGLYLRALRWGLFEQPYIDPKGREAMWKEVEAGRLEDLRKRLEKLDPEACRRIAPRDAPRIIRALEVSQTLGRPLSSLQSQWDNPRPRFPHKLVILTRPREVLVQRIERRVEAMIDAGWMDEVRALLDRGLTTEHHCFKALGYREIADHLQGRRGEEETIERIKTKTRRFAKHQMGWYRREIDPVWLEIDGLDLEGTLQALENLVAASH